MPEELLERTDLAEVPIAPQEDLVPPAPPEGLDTVLYEHDERAARADLRRQIAAMELALARLFGSAFPRKGIDFAVAGMGGPRLLSVDELERVRDGLAARIHDVSHRLHDAAYVEEKNRELIEEMTADPASYRWVRVNNADIGEPGCKHWHSRPKWGPVGLLMDWWRVKISSGCPLAKGLRPPEPLMPTKRQRRKRRRQRGAQPPQTQPAAVGLDDAKRAAAARRKATPAKRPEALWGSFPLSELVVLIGVILLILGFAMQAPVTVVVGLGLAALAGVELAAREHFTGYRSHNVLLAGAAGTATFSLLLVSTPTAPVACLAAGVIVFGGSAWLLVGAFRRRSGGAAYRIKP